MPITHNIRVVHSISNGARTLAQNVTHTYTAEGELEVSVAVPDESTDLEVVLPINVEAAKTIALLSDQNLTIETNDGTTPDDTINLIAGVPWIWHTDGPLAALSEDIASIFVTNASGEDATLQILSLFDATP